MTKPSCQLNDWFVAHRHAAEGPCLRGVLASPHPTNPTLVVGEIICTSQLISIIRLLDYVGDGKPHYRWVAETENTRYELGRAASEVFVLGFSFHKMNSGVECHPGENKDYSSFKGVKK